MVMLQADFNLRDDSVLSSFAHKEDKPLMRSGGGAKNTTREAENMEGATFSLFVLLLSFSLFVVAVISFFRFLVSVPRCTYFVTLFSLCIYS